MMTPPPAVRSHSEQAIVLVRGNASSMVFPWQAFHLPGGALSR
jgi:hypothetical protein